MRNIWTPCSIFWSWLDQLAAPCLGGEWPIIRALMHQDHYAALGLRSSATLADIKKAFRQQASLHHPDRNASPDAPARFRQVQQAYDVLSDSVKRQAYDDNRQRNLLDSPLDTARAIWASYFNRVLGH